MYKELWHQNQISLFTNVLQKKKNLDKFPHISHNNKSSNLSFFF